MKKIICLLMISALLLSLAACSGNKKGDSASSIAVDSSSETAAEPTTVGNDGTKAVSKTELPKTEGVDVDLTKMSSTMVYSEVLNMQQKPDEYTDKIVRMKGPFNVTELDGNRYYACVIKDAAACCSTGIEFVWAGEHSYPEDYPKVNEEITVTGTFNVYTEGKSKYLQLKDAEVVF
ncbi:hypothetical protein [Ruminococcus sp.]|uniref:hypothetical protein n=1 Tax=Ruminococcus sp. TaxID=41978 RepID=UPI0038682EB7